MESISFLNKDRLKKMIQSTTEDGYLIQIPFSFHCYDLLEYLGCGSTCVIFLVEEQSTHQKYAAKIMSKDDILERNLLNSIKNEVRVLQSIDHPNIIKIKEFFEFKNESEEEYYVIIMEYCSRGDLLDYSTKYGFKCESEKKKIFHGFLEAVKYLHQNGISHGDIKSENILLDSSLTPKLCDFGFCKFGLTAGNSDKNGTLLYAAPELFVEGEFDTLKSDIYAIGITLYSISELQFPFKEGDQDFIIKQIMTGTFSFRYGMDPLLQKLVEKCTNKNPKLRPSIEELINDEYLKFDENYEIVIDNDAFQKEIKSQLIEVKNNNYEAPYFGSYEALPI